MASEVVGLNEQSFNARQLTDTIQSAVGYIQLCLEQVDLIELYSKKSFMFVIAGDELTLSNRTMNHVTVRLYETTSQQRLQQTALCLQRTLLRLQTNNVYVYNKRYVYNNRRKLCFFVFVVLFLFVCSFIGLFCTLTHVLKGNYCGLWSVGTFNSRLLTA